MEKYTEMTYNNRRELYEKFLFYLQAKHSSGNEELTKLYHFALRYNLLPQFFNDSHLMPKERRPLYKGYLLFMQEKFGIKDADNFKLSFSLLIDEYILRYFEIELYGFPSFNEYMEKSTEFGPKETTKLLNDLYRSYCFDGLRWESEKNVIRVKNNKIDIINGFKDGLLNEADIKRVPDKSKCLTWPKIKNHELLSIEEIHDKLKCKIFTLPIYEKEKDALRKYLTHVTTLLIHHNSLKPKDYYRSFDFEKLHKQAGERETLLSNYKIKMINEFQDKILNKNEINIKRISDNLRENINVSPMNKKDKTDLNEYLANVTNSLTYYSTLRQMNLNVIDFFIEMQKSIENLKPIKTNLNFNDIEKV